MLSENPMIHFVNNTNTIEIAQASHYWIWNFGDGNSDNTTEAETSHIYTDWGDYTVTLTLWADGCVDSASVTVFIEADLEFPNVITPNGDGINDVYGPIPPYQGVARVEMEIFNRWGRRVFRTSDPDILWDGSDESTHQPCSEGVFYYSCQVYVQTLTGEYSYPLHGSITLIR
jgi:gliding motility-associated-like protein